MVLCVTNILALSISAAALLVSFVSARYSRRQTRVAAEQLELARQIRTEASNPYVIADIVPRVGGSGLLQFRIKNVGSTLARDVQLSVSPPLEGGESDEWDQKLARVIGRTIPVLPPGRQIEWNFSFGPRLFANPALPRQYTVTVNTTGPSGPVGPMAYVIDLDAIGESALERDTVEACLATIADHTKHLRDIPGALQAISNELEPRPSEAETPSEGSAQSGAVPPGTVSTAP